MLIQRSMAVRPKIDLGYPRTGLCFMMIATTLASLPSSRQKENQTLGGVFLPDCGDKQKTLFIKHNTCEYQYRAEYGLWEVLRLPAGKRSCSREKKIRFHVRRLSLRMIWKGKHWRTIFLAAFVRQDCRLQKGGKSFENCYLLAWHCETLKTTNANKSWLHLFFFNKEQDHPIHKSTSCWNVRLSDLCICAILNITLSTEPFSTSTTEKNYIDKSFPRHFLWSKKSRAKHKIYINLRRQAGRSKPNERLMGFDISADLVTPCSRGINLTFERLCCSIEM